MASGIVNIILNTFKRGSGLEEVAKDTAAAKQGLSDMGKAAQKLGSIFGNVSGVAGRMVKTFLQGGVWELAAQGVMAAINKWQEYREAAKKAAEDAAKAIGDSFKSAADAISTRFARVTAAISAAGSRAKELATFREVGHGAQAAEEIAAVNAKERERLSTADAGDRGVIKANAALERAKINAAEQTRSAAARVEESEDAIARANEAKRAAEEAYSKVLEKRNDIASRLNDLYYRRGKGEDDLDAAISQVEGASVEADKELVKATERLTAARSAVESAEIARNTELQRQRKAESEADAALAEAEDAVEAAFREKARAELEAAKEARKAAAKQAAKAAAEEERARIQAEGDQNLAATEKDYENQLAKLAGSIARLKRRYDAAEKGIARTQRGQSADAAHTNGLFGPYQYGGRSNGGENFIDWDRAQRFAGWGDRDAQKAARRDAAAQKRFDRIRDKLENGESVSGADEAFFDKFKAFQDQKNGAEKLKNALEEAQKRRDKLQQEMKDELTAIKQYIKAALAIG